MVALSSPVGMKQGVSLRQAKVVLKRLGEEEDAKRKVVEAEDRDRKAREEKNLVKKSGASTQVRHQRKPNYLQGCAGFYLNVKVRIWP